MTRLCYINFNISFASFKVVNWIAMHCNIAVKDCYFNIAIVIKFKLAVMVFITMAIIIIRVFKVKSALSFKVGLGEIIKILKAKIFFN